MSIDGLRGPHDRHRKTRSGQGTFDRTLVGVRFWHRARESGRVRFVREIDLGLPRVFRLDKVPPRNIQAEPLAMLNVESRGNVSSFSPELLGLKNKDYGGFLLGNVTRGSLRTILETCHASPLWRDIQSGVSAGERSCEYSSVCGASPGEQAVRERLFHQPRRRPVARSPRWCRPP